MQFAKHDKTLICKTSFRESLKKMQDLKGTMFDKMVSETLGHFSNEVKHVDWNGGTFESLFATVKLPSEVKDIKPMAVKRVKRRVVAGCDGELDVSNMWARKPYLEVTKRLKTSNVVTISVEYSFSANITSGRIDKFTRELLIAVKSLMMAGYSVGIEVTNYTGLVDVKKTVNSSSTITVKRPDDALSVQDVARVFTSNYYRRVVLDLREQSLHHHGVKSRHSGQVYEKPYRVKMDKGVVYIGNNLSVTADEVLKVVTNETM